MMGRQAASGVYPGEAAAFPGRSGIPPVRQIIQKIRRPIILKITPGPAEGLDWPFLHNTYTLLIVAGSDPGTPDNAFYLG